MAAENTPAAYDSEQVKAALRKHYEGNLAGATLVGVRWAQDHYRSLLREIERYPRPTGGALPDFMLDEAVRLGVLTPEQAGRGIVVFA